MCRAVTSALADPNVRTTAAERGPRLIDDRFSMVDFVRELLELAGERLKVSVIVPNYNYDQFLERRLASITQQTYRPFEIIFLDDCSTDNSVETAKRLLAGSAIRWRIIRSDSNQGCYRQWLRGVDEARGDLIWMAEADDYSDPLFLETLVAAFEDERVVLAYCQSKAVNEDDVIVMENYLAYTEEISATKWRAAYVREGADEIADTFSIKNPIPNASAVVMRKPDLSPIAPELSRLRNTGDWLTYVYLLSRGKVAYFPQPLNYHRRHRDSITLRNIHSGGVELMKEILAVQRYIRSNYPPAPEIMARGDLSTQATYDQLGLSRSGPREFRQHPALQPDTLPL
jgi:glycosyltransferase involved in cell wall biosynthesis